MVIYSQAPARVDLAGGTLDIWPLYLLHENPRTINFAIDCAARCRLVPRADRRVQLVSRDLGRRETFPSLPALSAAKRWKLPLHARLVLAFAEGRRGLPGGFTLETESGVPAGSGLGGSSALNVALCGALARFCGEKLAPAKLIELARNVEAQVLGVPTGEQDYYSALFGGVQAIHLTPRGIRSQKLRVHRAEINSRFVLCYTGHTRNSGINNWEVQKAHLDGHRHVIRHFDQIAAIAVGMHAALEQRDWESVARLLQQDWRVRKKNYPGITTATIERLDVVARRNGALAGKVCGAGGGGCMVFLAQPEAKGRLSAALRLAGAEIIPFGLSARGLQVRAASS